MVNQIYRLLIWCINLYRGEADYYFCGSDRLATLNGWWLSELPNPVFPLETTPAQRKLSYACFGIPGQCNVAVIDLNPVENGCGLHRQVVERNRSNPPEIAILAEMSSNTWEETVRWKVAEFGSVRFFDTEEAANECKNIDYYTTIGCAKPLPNFAAWSPRGGVLPATAVSKPSDVVVDKAGKLTIMQSASNKLTRWTQFEESGEEEELSFKPGGMDIDLATGSIFVSVPALHQVWRKFNGVWSAVCGTGEAGKLLTQLQDPTGVQVTPQGKIIIADTGNNRILLCSLDIPTMEVVAGGNKAGNSVDLLDGPQSAAMDTKGSVYVADTNNNRIMRWDPGSEFGIQIGGNSDGAVGISLSHLDGPTELGLRRHERGITEDPPVFVIDKGNNRVLVLQYPYQGEMNLVSGDVVSGNQSLKEPSGLFLDSEGTLYIADSNNDRIVRFNQRMIDNLKEPNCNNSLCCQVQCVNRHMFIGGYFTCDAVGQWKETSPITCIPLLCDEFPVTATFSDEREGWGTPYWSDTGPTYVASGLTEKPSCVSSNPVGEFYCDKGEVLWPFPWCSGKDLDVVKIAVVEVFVRGNDTEEVIENLGSPIEEIRLLSFYENMTSVAVIADYYVGDGLHPVYSLDHRLQNQPEVILTAIRWNFPLPYPTSRKGQLLPPKPLALAAPAEPTSLNDYPITFFIFVILGAFAGGLFLRCSIPKVWNFFNEQKTIRVWVPFAALAIFYCILIWQCVNRRGTHNFCRGTYLEAKEEYLECQTERMYNFTEYCIGSFSVTPYVRSNCFLDWPDRCIEEIEFEECPDFMVPCGWSTLLIIVMSAFIGLIFPNRIYTFIREIPPVYKEPPVSIGGYAKAGKGEIGSLLTYTIELPVGVKGGTFVNFPLDLENPETPEDRLLNGKTVCVKAPSHLNPGETFMVSYDREKETIEILTHEMVRAERKKLDMGALRERSRVRPGMRNEELAGLTRRPDELAALTNNAHTPYMLTTIQQDEVLDIDPFEQTELSSPVSRLSSLNEKKKVADDHELLL